MVGTFVFVISLTVVSAVSVHTKVGTILGTTGHRTIAGRSLSYSMYLGIPYGETTAGVNRLKKPIPKAPFKVPYNATEFGPSCMQNSGTGHSEDCLYLNVYVPVSQPSAIVDTPVMIWIHGGAFRSGAASDDNPENLSAFGDIIVVTINYRLGEFGFLSTGDASSPGNYGLWDQHLAIKWVHDNIQAFGGDPDQVTLVGESAGAASVHYQALYPGNKGMFKRIVLQSGSALAAWALTRSPNASPLLKKVSCTDIECLRGKSVSELNGVVNYDFLAVQSIFLSPIVDGDFIAETPEEIMFGNNTVSREARDFFYSLDLLTGINNKEGALYMVNVWPLLLSVSDYNDYHVSRAQFYGLAAPLAMVVLFRQMDPTVADTLVQTVYYHYIDQTLNKTNVKDELLQLSTDTAFTLPALNTANKHAQLASGKRTYVYYFTVQPQEHHIDTPTWLEGANHADEVPFLFGVPLTKPGAWSTEKRVSESIITMWTNFAKSGNPNQPKYAIQYTHTTWPEYNMRDKAYLEISSQMGPLSSKTNFMSNVSAFWLHDVPAIMNPIQPPASTPAVNLVG